MTSSPYQEEYMRDDQGRQVNNDGEAQHRAANEKVQE